MVFNTTYILYIITTILLIILVMSLQYGNINNLIYHNNFKNTIIAYYGDTPPHGWILCDGRIVNGIQTPDLRNKFVMGGNETSQNTLQSYLKNIDFSKLTDENAINLNNIYDFNNYITDSTNEIQGGKNFANKTSRIFNKEIIKSNLINIQNSLINRDEDPEKIENIQTLVSQITASYNDVIDESADINNSHIFNNNIETDDVKITSITNIQPIIDTVPDIVPPSKEETSTISADVDNTTKYNEIKDIKAGTTDSDTPIEKDQYKNWLDGVLGENTFTDNEYNLLWDEFSNEGYDDNYIDSFSVSRFMQELNNSDITDDIIKHKLIVKLYFAYDPTTHTKITNKESVYTEYGNYKYPSSKQLTADNNLPPYYSLIYIMKL